jgi:hypothetical protein
MLNLSGAGLTETAAVAPENLTKRSTGRNSEGRVESGNLVIMRSHDGRCETQNHFSREVKEQKRSNIESVTLSFMFMQLSHSCSLLGRLSRTRKQ